jgi:hypothetical protein
MAIVIGDLHGDLEKTKAFIAYKPKEKHVALGDYVDSFFVRPEQQIEALKLLLASNCVLLWGNHDLQYLPQRPWICSGYQEKEAYLYCHLFAPALENNRLKAAYAADGWLCTHAGVSPEIADLIPREYHNPEAAADWLNADFERTRLIPQDKPPRKGYPKFCGTGPIYNIARTRGGNDEFGGIFWFDTHHEGVPPSPLVGKQLFGHTERSEPQGVSGEWWNLDATNSIFCWIYDTTKDQPECIPYL